MKFWFALEHIYTLSTNYIIVFAHVAINLTDINFFAFNFLFLLTFFKLRPAIVGDSLVDIVDARVSEYIANMLGTTPCIKVDQFVPRLLLSHLPRSQSENFPRCWESYGWNFEANRYLPIFWCHEKWSCYRQTKTTKSVKWSNILFDVASDSFRTMKFESGNMVWYVISRNVIILLEWLSDCTIN